MRIHADIDERFSVEVREMVELRVAFKFSRFAEVTRAVHVSLRDENGPRGGEDIRCCVRVQLPGHPDVLIVEKAATVREVLTLSMERATRMIARELRRKSSRRRYQRRRTSTEFLPQADPADYGLDGSR